MIDSLCMFDDIPLGARQSASRRIQQLRNDQHSQALRPKDWSELENLALAVSVGMYHSGAASTKHGDELWRTKYWQPFRLYYQLPDVLIAPAITDVEGLEREAFTLAVYFMWIAKRMIPRAKTSVAPKPDSVMQVVRSLLRMQKHGGHRCSKGACWMVSLLLDGMKHLYLDEHGQDSLQPSRKEPFNGDSLQKLLDMRSQLGKNLTDKYVIDNTPFWDHLFTVFEVNRFCGFRLDELARPQGQNDLTRGHLTWHLNGASVLSPTSQQLDELKDGDYAMIKPVPCKNDQFGHRFGAFPIYLTWRKEQNNPAQALANIEQKYPVESEMRAEVPLFCASMVKSVASNTGWVTTPFTKGGLSKVFRALMTDIVGLTQAQKHSMHSFRIDLATRLHASGASDGTIQRLLRWSSPASILIYGRDDSKQTGEALHATRFQILNTQQSAKIRRALPQHDMDEVFQEAFAEIPAMAAQCAEDIDGHGSH